MNDDGGGERTGTAGRDAWVLVTDVAGCGALVAAARAVGGRVIAVVVGDRTLADEVAVHGPDEVRWVDPPADVPPEAFSTAVADEVARARPRVLAATGDAAARALLGAAAVRSGAALVPGVTGLSTRGDVVVVERSALDGEVVETLTPTGPVAVVFTGQDAGPGPATPAPVRVWAPPAAGPRVVRRRPTGPATGLADAARVVAFGRGVRARDDVALIERLADALGAELACTLPVATDLGWLDRSRYVGRSGRHIAPRLYLAVGIAGAPQHLEGVREARVVAAVNNDPDARVFRTADLGVVGDLYEIVPALIEALDGSATS